MVMPAKLTTLVQGKSIGAHKGLGATWNYILSLVKHFATGKAAGKGVTTTGFVVGTPKIGVEILPGPGVSVVCGGDGQPYTIGLDGSGNGAGEGGSGNGGAWVWDAENKTFLHTWAQVGRKMVHVSPGSSLGDGNYYLSCSMSSLTVTLNHTFDPNADVPDSTDSVTNLYVATIEDGEQTDGIFSTPVFYFYE